VKKAFTRRYGALLATNVEVAKKDEQEWKDTMNRVYYSKYMFGDGTDQELRQVHCTVWIYTRGKALFVTKGGRIGLGIGDFRSGSELAVIGGLAMPLFLTAVGNRYRLRGYSYYHGIMEGQAWQDNKSELRMIRIE
jgi:hypothetical protein